MVEFTEKQLVAMRPGDLLNAYDDLKAELAEAKASGDRGRLHDAKTAVDKFRSYWRQVDVLEGSSGRQADAFVSTGNQAEEG